MVQQYLKKGAQIYVEGQITTRKWKDEQSGQDKYSTEIVIQGYNSSLTMLGGGIVVEEFKMILLKLLQIILRMLLKCQIDMDDEIPF